jgi:hypothetical protein
MQYLNQHNNMYALSYNKADDETTNTQIPTTSTDAQCIPQTDMFKLPF